MRPIAKKLAIFSKAAAALAAAAFENRFSILFTWRF